MNLLARLSLILAMALCIEALAWPQDVARGQVQARAGSNASVSSFPGVSAPSASGRRGVVTRYSTELEGDHSLEAAIVAEQVFAQGTLYTIQLQFASGAEQSIAVTAPPGGLQPEMRDMTGDSVPNDVILTSRLLGWPLVVLLNDGHDHLTVASSPGSFTSGEGRASGPHQVRHASALVSSGFKARGITDGGGLFPPQPRQDFLSPISQIVTKLASYRSSSGRAPPALVTKI